MRDASDVGVAGGGIETQVPDVAKMSLLELHRLSESVSKPTLASVVSRLTSAREDLVSPFASYLP